MNKSIVAAFVIVSAVAAFAAPNAPTIEEVLTMEAPEFSSAINKLPSAKIKAMCIQLQKVAKAGEELRSAQKNAEAAQDKVIAILKKRVQGLTKERNDVKMNLYAIVKTQGLNPDATIQDPALRVEYKKCLERFNQKSQPTTSSSSSDAE